MSMSDQAPRQQGRKNLFRTVAAVSTAAILLGSSFYAAQAGSAGFYTDDGDEDTAKVVGVTLGVTAAVFFVAGAIEKGQDKKEGSSDDKAKSANAAGVQQVRVVSSRTGLAAGDAAVLQVQAKYAGSEKWQDVTESAVIRQVSGSLTPVDGSKNAFAVPIGSKVVPGAAVIQAEFGGRSATTQLNVN
jgi:hypothetical protein